MDRYSQMAAGRGSDEESASRMMMEEDRAAPSPTDGWVVDNISIRQAKNGGWIVSCSKHQNSGGGTGNEPSPGRYESNDYTFGALAEAVPFIESEFGASTEGAGAEAPATPMGRPAGGMGMGGGVMA